MSKESTSRPDPIRKRSGSDTTAGRNTMSMADTAQGNETRDRSQSVTAETARPSIPPSTGFDSTDRVFPIRSVVSVAPAPASGAQSWGATSPVREGARQYPIIDSRTWDEMQARARSPAASPPSSTEPTAPTATARHETHTTHEETDLAAHSMATQVVQNPEEYIEEERDGDKASISSSTPHASVQRIHPEDPYSNMTTRFTHKVTEDGHVVITGRDGEFQYCEDEPIRIPGAIQSFGVMLALREEMPNQLVVRIVSENAHDIMGYTPRDLFNLENFCDILKEDQADNLLDHVDFVRDDAYDPTVDGPDVFVLVIPTPSGEDRRFWCAAHVSPSQKDLIICELELEEDEKNPLNVEGRATPATPADTLGAVPTAEQFAASMINISQPLRVLRNARRRKGEAAAMEVFSILSQIQEQLGRANDLDTLLNTATGLVKELTGFHRVLIYQFDSSWNGLVVAELMNPDASIDIFKGLHFPASDIPAQARELYKINKVRILYDRDRQTSRLVCRTLDDLETPLDMTHAFLRAMSPVHVKYLANMEVRASMSISINAFNDLWGLISCHTYGDAGMRVSFPVRKMCRLLGDTVSRNIERLSYANRLQARKLINTVPTEANPSGYIIASTDDLLQLFNADYGALSIRDETKILGNGSNTQEVLALLEFIRMRQLNSVLASHDIIKDFPDFRYDPGLKAISGLLYVPLSTGGNDFIVFFRKGHLTEISWAGNPYEIKKQKETAGYLEPRQSFTTWRESVLSQSREWSETDVETAAVLCLVYGKFIKVWRQKEAAMQNSQLTRLLLANSAHEVRTPLNAIINYLEIALEGALDSETRDSLTKSHSASKSLIYVINDLLDLTNTEKGRELIKDESFDLPDTFHEATDMLSGEARRKQISFTVSAQPGIPRRVLGDQRRVRQVFSNIISNAIQQTESGAVTVELWRSAIKALPDHVAVEMMVMDTGAGMSKQKLEALFHELEQVSSDDDYYPEENNNSTPPSSSKRVLGLGLALVARIVYNMHGQLGVKSEEGKGSRFKVLLQFRLPEGEPTATPAEATLPGHVAAPLKPTIYDREFTLTRGHQQSPDGRRRSSESLRSGSSSRSARSQADRLISAMQEPALGSRSGSETGSLSKVKLPISPHGSGEVPLSVGSPPLPPPSTRRRSNSFRVSAGHNPHASLATVSHTPPLSLQPTSVPSLPGTTNVTDSGVPLRNKTNPISHRCRPGSRTNSWEHASTIGSSTTPTSIAPSKTSGAPLLSVLVAEDDPINCKIIQKRLTKLGHTVEVTMNGEACATAFATKMDNFDVILMDIQMPIVDGMGATRSIRDFETKVGTGQLSDKAKLNDRVPIFAVSASLQESDKQKYIDTGFDGWVMKPIDFNRLNVLFNGLTDAAIRKDSTYTPGEWENGGWF
ncbi:hypothetical protein N7468_008765 [Penicillium chermesinum]|uniref:Phytochrome n=1 Tax=Penicillium chermesinum TaxID=63820 RepID=A0A9W9TEE0_9EURO|nr:uncharacterized protein N7468_008765 [Penicillium chermesinum]KAJ5219561.1 hypothetical protein N7468_008765 [Penicillium chermesinum]